MKTFKKVIELEHEKIKSFTAWSHVHYILSSHCYCTSVMTDLESYIEVEAENKDCLEDLCKQFEKLGFHYKEYTPKLNSRIINEKN